MSENETVVRKLSRRQAHAGMFVPGVPLHNLTQEDWAALSEEDQKAVDAPQADGHPLYYEPQPQDQPAEPDPQPASEERPARKRRTESDPAGATESQPEKKE